MWYKIDSVTMKQNAAGKAEFEVLIYADEWAESLAITIQEEKFLPYIPECTIAAAPFITNERERKLFHWKEEMYHSEQESLAARVVNTLFGEGELHEPIEADTERKIA